MSWSAGNAFPPSETTSLRAWEVFEIDIPVKEVFQNPYIECLRDGEKVFVSARFTGISGAAGGQIYEVPGFWDGGNNWKIRFAPPSAGEWEFETYSRGKRKSEKKGVLIVSDYSEEEKNQNPTRRGFLYVNQQEPGRGRYFIYADKTPCLWIADTWWDWTNSRITLNSFRNLVDTRSEQGFNIGQLFFAANGWGRESSLLDNSFQNPKLEQIRKVEEMIRYANSKGISVWIHPWWTRKGISQSIGEENIRRWWRYVIARLHAYNVVWVVAGEYNMNNYGGFPLDFWTGLGEMIRSEDPYKRIIGAHPTPPMWDGGAEAPQWSTASVLHNQPWLDYNQSQTGHARWCNELTPAIIKEAYEKVPAKPIVITEPWYEFIEGNPTAMDIRFGAWASILSGSAGHTYGGGHIWLAHLPEKPAGGGTWPLDKNFEVNTLNYPGALSISFMAKYLRRIEWWRLSPHPEIVLENPSPLCASDPGNEYLIFLRYGGSVKIDFTSFPENTKYNYFWLDLVNSTVSREGSFQGGSITEIKCPEDFPGKVNFKDWILHIYKDQPTSD